MTSDSRSDAVSKLFHLADELEGVYPAAGDRVAEAVKPVAEAISRIGVAYRSPHYAEDCKSGSFLDARPSDYCFYQEQSSEAGVEYALCAARGADRKCGLYASVCEYREFDEDYEDNYELVRSRHKVVIDSLRIMRPGELPLPIRVRVLDVLDQFVEDYGEHVRKDRSKLLNGSVVPKPSE